MVKLTGPMMSIAASGKFADTMVFAKKGNTAYARQRVIPFNPKSAAQTGNRALFEFLAQQWANLSAPQKASWQALADSLSGQPFNAYMHENQLNWKQFLSPGMTYPVARTDLAGVIDNVTSSAVGQVGQALITTDLSTLNQNWGIAIFRSTSTGFTPAPNNLVHISPAPFATPVQYVDSPLQPGTYYYVYRPLSLEGVWGADSTEDTAVVT